jgi:hypothetical protein
VTTRLISIVVIVNLNEIPLVVIYPTANAALIHVRLLSADVFNLIHSQPSYGRRLDDDSALINHDRR